MDLTPWIPVPPDGAATAEALARELAALGVSAEDCAARLRAALLGVATFPTEWLQTPQSPALFQQAALWVRSTFGQAEALRANAVTAGAIFDGLIDGGALSAQDLAGFFQQFFNAIVHRQPMPSFGDPRINDALQLIADLFVDAANSDAAVLAMVPMHVDLIAAGQKRPSDLVLYLHDKLVAVS